MVEDYLSDREQEEALRNWWRENWLWVLGGIVVGLIGLGGWQFWKDRQDQQGEAAAKLFDDFTKALASPTPGAADREKAQAILKQLDADHSGSPYVDQGHLLSARVRVSAGEYEQAIAELKAVADRSKDEAMVQLARTRMARLQLQLGHPDEALALIDVSKAGAFARTANEVRGDALLAKGDRSGARLAYQAAMNEGADQGGPGDAELLKLKLQDLEDAVPVANAAPVPNAAPSAEPASAPAK